MNAIKNTIPVNNPFCLLSGKKIAAYGPTAANTGRRNSKKMSEARFNNMLFLLLNMYMRILIFISFWVTVSYANAQTTELEKYIEANEENIDTIQLAHGSTLPFFDKAINGVDVIFLGEPSHFDGAAFTIKSKLIKYLYEKHGFNILAFECDFFSLDQGWQKVDKKSLDNTKKFIHANLFKMWSGADQNRELLYEFVPKHTDLRLSGIDPSFSGQYTRTEILNFLKSEFVKRKIDTASKESLIFFNNISLLNPFLNVNIPEALSLFKKSKGKYVQIIEYIDKISPPISDKNSLFYQVLSNIRIAAIILCHRAENPKVSINSRDEQMAKNLEWIYNHKKKNDKIIVWAANYHIKKNSSSQVDRTMKTMVQRIKESGIIKNFYSIGITSLQGKYTLDGKTLQDLKSSSATVESYFNYQYDFAFLNLSDFSQNQKFYSNLNAFQPSESNWSQVYDGLINIKTAKPATYHYLRNIEKQ